MVSIESPVEIQLSLGNPIYRGPEGKKPVKGVDYFTQEDIDSIVAQIGSIDLDRYATKEYVDDAVEGVVVEETDPTVPEWAKQANKPTYTANEVGALPADTVLFSGNYEDLSNKPTISVVPTNVSSFANDAGYLTEHQSLTDYATKSYVETIIRGAESGLLKRSVVQTLPVSDIDENTIYMVAKTGSTGDVYDEYLYVNNNWEHIGSTDVDLTGYRKTYSFPANTSLTQEQIDILAECYTLVEGKYNTIIRDLPFGLYIENLPVWGIRSSGDNYLSFYTWYISAGMYGTGIGFPATEYYYTFNKTSNGTYPTQLTRNASSMSADALVITHGNTLDGNSEQQIGSAFSYIKNNYATKAELPEGLPIAPTTDGTYFLKSVVSSGVATQSWENVVIGGSY